MGERERPVEALMGVEREIEVTLTLARVRSAASTAEGVVFDPVLDTVGRAPVGVARGLGVEALTGVEVAELLPALWIGVGLALMTPGVEVEGVDNVRAGWEEGSGAMLGVAGAEVRAMDVLPLFVPGE